MRLDDERQSRNVEDRRFQRGLGGNSMQMLFMLWPVIRALLRTKFGWAIIAVGIGAYLLGFNPLALFLGAPPSGPAVSQPQDDSQAVFIKKVLATTEDIWGQMLPRYGYSYKPPVLVLYRGSTHSGCGFASAQIGPFYCPADQKIYLDLGFFDQLERRFNAPGDFAQAYVLAHEVGHHIQKIMGILDKVHALQQQALRRGDKVKANHLQIPVELHADCLAGVWGHYAKGHLEPGDIEEAMNAANRIGDDTLQKESQGYVVPDSFTHGTARQRMKWFMEGFKSGDLESCNAVFSMNSF